jgi:TRAP-type C4-dicarboxylate transport system permease small subunit
VSEQLLQDVQARGNFGYSIARAFGRNRRGRAPLAIASFIAIPLFFSSLMASTLAQEKPHVIQWTSGGKLQTTYHDPTSATEARIWLWALLPPALLILTGWVASRLPYGFYIACLAAIVDALAVVHKTATWEAHHTQRFPNGVDLIAANNPASNQFDPGQWEHMARATALSLEHWTIALAFVSMFVITALTVKRRYFGRRPAPTYGAVESVGAPSITLPEISDN